MSWTAPATWVAGALVAASDLNTQLRDNLSILKTSLDDNGKLQSLASGYVAAPPCLSTNTSAVGNVGAGTDDLMTYELAAGLLATNGWGVTFEGGGDTAANGDTKQVGFTFGGTQVLLTAGAALNNKTWWGQFTIVRVDATNQRCSGCVITDSTIASAGSASPTETLANAITGKFIGVGVSNNDVVQRWMKVTQFRT